MPTFEITAPNGKTYRVDGDNAEGALAAVQGMHQAQSGPVEDVGKSIVGGLAEGATKLAGMVPDISSLAHAGANKLFDALGMPPKIEGAQPPDINQLAGSANIQKGVESLTGPFYQSQTPAGKFARSAAESVPGALAMGPGGIAIRSLSGIGAGLGSEAAGQLTNDNPLAKIGGAMVGGISPYAAGRMVTPLPASAARQTLVDILNNEGVTSLTVGQRTGNKTLQYAESVLGDTLGAGSKADAVQKAGLKQFTEAAMRRTGAGPDATSEVLSQNSQRLGNEFETLSARNNMVPDNQFITDITDAVREYKNVPNSQQRSMVQGYVDDIIQHVNAGHMPGPQYQEMRSRLTRQSFALKNSDPTLSDALRNLRNSLDDAMGRSIAPADQAAWQTARLQYGAQKAIEKSVAKAGEAAAEGQIVPSALRNAVTAGNRGAYARGEGQFADLARAGSGVMAPLPQSGTAPRVAVHALASMLGGGAAALGGDASLASMGAALGASAGPAVAGRALMSGAAQGYLGNQMLAPLLRGTTPAKVAQFQALMEAARLKQLNQGNQ